MTATLGALDEGRGQPTAAVMTSDGATWSWSDLFDQFAPAIRSFARSRGISNPEDIVQDVFATAVERFPRFEGDASGLRSFLFTLAFRRVADEHRNSYRRQERLVADHQPTADESLGIEDSYTDREDAVAAMRALEILGDRERQVIEMRIIDEASPTEVADALGLSNGNVRVIQARALMKIRKYLESESGSLPSLALVFAFAKCLRTELPTDGRVAAWIELVQSASSRISAKTAAVGAGSAIAAATSSTAAIAVTVLKVGMVVALVTASTSSVATGSPDGHAGLQDLVGAPTVVSVEEEAEPARFAVPSAIVHAPSSDVGIAPVTPNRPSLVPPSESVAADSSAENRQTPKSVVAEGSEVGSHRDEGGSIGVIVGDVVDPVADGVADTVDDVVKGVVDTVDTVVDVVDDSVNTVGETVTDPVATVNEVADDTTDAVEETIDTATDVVDDVLGGDPVNGLLFP